MARLNLREFSTPDFADMIPKEEWQERAIPKIRDFAQFLHTVPWFKKDGDETEDTGSEGLVTGSEAGTTPAEVSEDVTKSMVKGKDIGELAKKRTVPLDRSVELSVLADTENPEDFARALEAAEIRRMPLTAPDTDLFDKARLGRIPEGLSAYTRLSPEQLQALAIENPKKFEELQKYLKSVGYLKRYGADKSYGRETQEDYDKWVESIRG